MSIAQKAHRLARIARNRHAIPPPAGTRRPLTTHCRMTTGTFQNHSHAPILPHPSSRRRRPNFAKSPIKGAQAG